MYPVANMSKKGQQFLKKDKEGVGGRRGECGDGVLG